MASRLLESIATIPHNFDSDVVVSFFDDHFDLLQYIVVLYVLLVVYGPAVLERLQYGDDPVERGMTPEEKKAHRAPREAAFQRKVVQAMRVWNAVLSVFSLLGSISLYHAMGYLLTSRSFYHTVCDFDGFAFYDGEAAFWIFYFMVSKIPEMMDTVFLILQKKRVIFLHSYHHLTVTVFCWYAGRSLYPPGIFFNGMNYFVHTLMYAYFFFSSFRALRKVTSVFAPLITFLQIAQMVAGFGISLYVAFFTFVYSYSEGVMSLRGTRVHACGAETRVTRMGLLMYGSYFFLFVGFFLTKYTRKSHARSRHRGAPIASEKATPAPLAPPTDGKETAGMNSQADEQGASDGRRTGRATPSDTEGVSAPLDGKASGDALSGPNG